MFWPKHYLGQREPTGTGSGQALVSLFPLVAAHLFFRNTSDAKLDNLWRSSLKQVNDVILSISPVESYTNASLCN